MKRIMKIGLWALVFGLSAALLGCGDDNKKVSKDDNMFKSQQHAIDQAKNVENILEQEDQARRDALEDN